MVFLYHLRIAAKKQLLSRELMNNNEVSLGMSSGCTPLIRQARYVYSNFIDAITSSKIFHILFAMNPGESLYSSSRDGKHEINMMICYEEIQWHLFN